MTQVSTRLSDPVVRQEDLATFNLGNSLNMICRFIFKWRAHPSFYARGNGSTGSLYLRIRALPAPEIKRPSHGANHRRNAALMAHISLIIILLPARLYSVPSTDNDPHVMGYEKNQ